MVQFTGRVRAARARTALKNRVIEAIQHDKPFPTTDEVPQRATRSRVQYRGKAKVVRRAKRLNEEQFRRALAYIAQNDRNPLRSKVIMLLSFFCGLRAKEIAGLQWDVNVEDAEGSVTDTLLITHNIGKNSRERTLPLNGETRIALRALRRQNPGAKYVIEALYKKSKTSKRAKELDETQTDPNTLVKFVNRMYLKFGYRGCTSHSGRRTFGTNLARKCNKFGAGINDVQQLMGHADLESLAPYLDPSDQQRELAANVF